MLQYITNDKNSFYFHTNKNASNYRIVKIDFDNPKEAEWKDLISEHPKDVLDWAHAINENMLVVCYLQDVKVWQLFMITLYDSKNVSRAAPKNKGFGNLRHYYERTVIK